MTYKQLADVYREHAFDPRIVQDWFTATHVPFDDLFRTNAIEGRVRDSAKHGGRVAVIGRSGTGKTSEDLFAEESLTRLFDIYLEHPEPTIRKCLTIANAAVGVTIEQHADQVTGLHLDSAQADLG